MDLYLIRYFLALVEAGSFTKAAQACLITQPTLSAGIKRLEDSLGVALFVRTNRRVFLTEAGTRFLGRAKIILNECNMALDELKAVESRPTVRLGVVATVPFKCLSGFIGFVQEKRPEIRISLFEGTEQEIQNRLEERALDAAITLLRQDEGVTLWSEAYPLALSRLHPLAKEASIEAGELAQEGMIVRTRCEVLSETSRHFTDANVRPPLSFRTLHDERALEMVAAGVGVTIMPESYTHPDVVRIPLKGFVAKRTVGFVMGPQGQLKLDNPVEKLSHLAQQHYALSKAV